MKNRERWGSLICDGAKTGSPPACHPSLTKLLLPIPVILSAAKTLHHPDYRQRYAANLRRELPRIPFVGSSTFSVCHSEPAKAGEEPAVLYGANAAGKQQIPPSGRNDKGDGNDKTSPSANPSPGGAADNSPEPALSLSKGRKSGVNEKKENNSTLPKAVVGERSSQATGTITNLATFRAFVQAGQRLAEIHVHYEQQPGYKLTKVEKPGEKLDYLVTGMRLSKDKTSLIYNQFLTLSGIPKETYEYRLGNRSALEWIIDQYQFSTDKRSGITNDPNRADHPTYILRLIAQVVTVSLETVRIVASLPSLGIPDTPLQ